MGLLKTKTFRKERKQILKALHISYSNRINYIRNYGELQKCYYNYKNDKYNKRQIKVLLEKVISKEGLNTLEEMDYNIQTELNRKREQNKRIEKLELKVKTIEKYNSLIEERNDNLLKQVNNKLKFLDNVLNNRNRKVRSSVKTQKANPDAPKRKRGRPKKTDSVKSVVSMLVESIEEKKEN